VRLMIILPLREFNDRLILSLSVLLTYITELQEEDSLRSSVRDVYDQN
jgi:hypothetical protein